MTIMMDHRMTASEKHEWICAILDGHSDVPTLTKADEQTADAFFSFVISQYTAVGERDIGFQPRDLKQELSEVLSRMFSFRPNTLTRFNGNHCNTIPEYVEQTDLRAFDYPKFLLKCWDNFQRQLESKFQRQQGDNNITYNARDVVVSPLAKSKREQPECKFHRGGYCKLGTRCKFAHYETQQAPQRYVQFADRSSRAAPRDRPSSADNNSRAPPVQRNLAATEEKGDFEKNFEDTQKETKKLQEELTEAKRLLDEILAQNKAEEEKIRIKEATIKAKKQQEILRKKRDVLNFEDKAKASKKQKSEASDKKDEVEKQIEIESQRKMWMTTMGENADKISKLIDAKNDANNPEIDKLEKENKDLQANLDRTHVSYAAAVTAKPTTTSTGSTTAPATTATSSASDANKID